MNVLQTKHTIARYALIFACSLGLLRAAVGEVTPLSKADLTKVEGILTKSLKGKPTVEGGKKEELENGWKITCTANVGSGGEFDFVVMAEKSMVLGYVESQQPKKAPAAAAPGKGMPARNEPAPKKT